MPPRRQAPNRNNQEDETDQNIQRLHDLSENASEYNRTLSNVLENINGQLKANTQSINNMQSQLNKITDMQNKLNDSIKGLSEEIHNMNPQNFPDLQNN